MENAIKTKLIVVVAKLISIGLVIASFWITFSPSSWGSAGPIYAVIMLVENTAFVSSVSPMAIFLIPLAGNLISTGSVFYLLLGYFAAVAGNLMSYAFGRMTVAKTPNVSSDFKILAVTGTYWHPQLASLTAFGAGAGNVPLARFLTVSLPLSALYYFSVVAAIFAAGDAITSAVSSDGVLLAMLSVWVLWDLVQLFSIVRARR
ncbi:hypothetical protein LZK73_11810 [Neorhizobium galegae]|nr:hypothetical protein LZK73_11810 [Neorhizobium galegae]